MTADDDRPVQSPRPTAQKILPAPAHALQSFVLTHIYGVTARLTKATHNTYGVTSSYTLHPIIGPQWYATKHLATS